MYHAEKGLHLQSRTSVEQDYRSVKANIDVVDKENFQSWPLNFRTSKSIKDRWTISPTQLTHSLTHSLTHQGVEPRDARELLERGAAVARLQNHHLGALPPLPSARG